jgi:hypothetical protein
MTIKFLVEETIAQLQDENLWPGAAYLMGEKEQLEWQADRNKSAAKLRDELEVYTIQNEIIEKKDRIIFLMEGLKK